MATANVTLYSTPAAARKGAKRAGMLAFDIIQQGDKFKFVSTAEQAVKPVEQAVKPAEQAAPKAKAAGKRSGPTKVDQVRALAERECGVRLLDIARELGVSKSVASSLVGDLRRKGVEVKYVQREDGEGIYRI